MKLYKSHKLNDPGCVNAAVTILGDKWSPLIIRALATKTCRFCTFETEVTGINPRTLSARLSMLEINGIITKTSHPGVPPRTEYSLTKKGQDLLPILSSMAAWSKRYATP